jgi:hypothetical protein
MPFENEHAARLQDPKKYKVLQRTNDKFGAGVDAIFGKKDAKSPMELQALRFNKDKFTLDEAEEWLKSHKVTATEFTPAKTEQDAKCGEGDSLSSSEESSSEESSSEASSEDESASDVEKYIRSEKDTGAA